LAARQGTTELNLVGPSAKLAYTLGDLSDLGIISRTQAYVENREGRLAFRKVGRKTIVLHEDLLQWLRSLPQKQTISEPHRKRALRRWGRCGD
jgi:hypothetical protein